MAGAAQPALGCVAADALDAPSPEMATVLGIPGSVVATDASTANASVCGRYSTRAGAPGMVGVTVRSTMFSLRMIGVTSRLPLGTRYGVTVGRP